MPLFYAFVFMLFLSLCGLVVYTTTVIRQIHFNVYVLRLTVVFPEILSTDIMSPATVSTVTRSGVSILYQTQAPCLPCATTTSLPITHCWPITKYNHWLEMDSAASSTIQYNNIIKRLLCSSESVTVLRWKPKTEIKCIFLVRDIEFKTRYK